MKARLRGAGQDLQQLKDWQVGSKPGTGVASSSGTVAAAAAARRGGQITRVQNDGTLLR